ncbi:hypothetical protein 6939_0027 [Klebsiella phage 6939]|uniref:Uncharacterized protein n=1 Tax=Klebsiella phage 6939 TaxID=2912295 RepID=A0A9E7M6M5_9CAUD|nr:hypothetical protein 6939_0027 [Klebsiella phage 6939]
MRYVIRKQPDENLWYVKDEWANRVLVSDASRDYCEGFLAGLANKELP